MIKVYDSTEKLFNNNGIKILKPLFAQITKKDNSDYYLELEDTIDNLNYYQKGLIIRTTTNWGVQGFRCNNPKIENNRIKCKAWHLTYDSKNYIVRDSNSVDKSCNAALNHFNSATDVPSPFTTISDIETILSCRMVRKSLYEVFNELIDETKYGGHLYRDNFTFGIKSSIGEDRGVVLAANKNITGMSVSENWDDVCTKILPYTTDGQKVITLNDVYVSLTEQLYDIPYSKVVKFENPYKEEDYNDRNSFEIAVKNWLKNEAMAYLEKNKLPKVNYTVEAQINNVSDIGDVIHVKHPKCNIDLITNVISITYDCIRNKYVKIEFGNFKKEIKNLTQQITESANKYSDSLVSESNTYMKNELLDATSKINAVLGNSYVIYDGDKILIVNKLPKEEAKDVIMISNGGIGFSRTGINGTFKNAWTIDGNFCADFITTGKINTDLIEGYSNLELAVQNSLLSITPQYCIEGKDEWSDTIPTTETWQKILTRNKYVATNGKITYSKVIPYVEGMNNLINSIEGTDVSIYNSNDEEMGLESIVLDGRCTQETRSGKNLFDINYTYKVGDTFTYKGVTITFDENGYITLNGTAETNGDLNIVAQAYTITLDKDIYLCFEALSGSVSNPLRGVNVQAINKSGASIWSYGVNANNPIAKVPYSEITNIKWIRVPLVVGLSFNNYKFRFWVSIENNLNYEPYGVMPSPDYPSEVECIKGKNLFDGVMESGGINNTTGNNQANSSLLRSKNYVSVKPNSTYIISNNGVGVAMNVLEYASDKSFISFVGVITAGKPFTTSSSTCYIRFYRSNSNADKIQLEKGSVATDYVPYNNIQIKDVGKNLFDENNLNFFSTANGKVEISNHVITMTALKTVSSNDLFVIGKIDDSLLVNGESYTISSVNVSGMAQSFRLQLRNKDGSYVPSMPASATITYDDTYGLYVINNPFSTSGSTIISEGTVAVVKNIQVEKGSVATDYAPYQSQILNIDLQGNKLCSKSDVKDKLIIKNGRAKILKKIGEIVVKEVGNVYSINSDIPNTTYVKIYSILKDNPSASSKVALPMSNYLPGKHIYAIDQIGIYTDSSDVAFRLPKAIGTTKKEINAWLSTHNLIIYYVLAQEKEINLGEVDNINLFTEDNNILNSESANMKIGYYTDYTFYKTVMEQYAKIDLNNDNINIELAKKTNSKDIIATINMSTEKDDEGSLIQINSDKLNIKNKVFNLQSDDIRITSPNFSVSTEGKITSKSGEIGGFKLTGTSFSTHVKDSYTYTQTDAARVLEIANGSTATEAEKKKYDVNEDGVIDRLDYTIILRKIYGYEATEGDFYIYSNDPRYMIKTSTNGTKTKPTKIGLTMMSTTEYNGCRANFTNFDDATSQTIVDGGQINCVALTQTSLEQHKKNIEKFSNAIEEIKKTDIYRYNMKSESNNKKKHLGFVIGKGFNYSHLITAENEEGKEIGVDNYSMISLCLQAIKEQQVIIENLETKINTLMKGIK